MADPGARGDTADTSCSEHGGRVAAFVLFLLLLVGRSAGGGVVVSLVAVGVAEEGALVVTAGCLVRCARWWWRIWTRR